MEASAPLPHTDRSPLAAGSGFVLLAGIAILLGFLWGGRPGAEGRRGPFGFSVTLKDVARCYELTWSPRGFCPSKHGTEPFGSPVYGIWWISIIFWLAFAGVYLVVLALVRSIHVYRETELIASASCVALALVLAGLWNLTFRMGAAPKALVRQEEKDTMTVRKALKDDGIEIDVDRPMPDFEPRKKLWFWISFVLLLIAWISAEVAIALLQPLTWPGNQFGTMILLGGGYGLFAGWLLYALSLNVGIATASESCPDGTTRPPSDAGEAYTASLAPIAFAVLLLIVSVVLVEPVQTLPWILTLLIFVPKFKYNIIALAICVVAFLGAGVRLYFVRWH